MVLRDKLIKDMDHGVWLDFTHWCASNDRKVSEALADAIKEFLFGRAKNGSVNKKEECI